MTRSNAKVLHSRILSIAVFAGGFMAGARLSAQQSNISGTVSDIQGVVPEATVTLHTPNGSKDQTRTDPEGKYTFSNLGSGPYELSFAKEGFETTVRTILLEGDPEIVNVTLALGGVSSSVDVTDSALNSTGSRMDVPDRDIPSQISVVTQETIREQGLNDVATALENVSGASVQVQYGVYEWYTLDGFAQQSGNDFLYIDGMTLMGNRPQTQLDNVEEVQVFKGPDGVLYGGAGASMGGMVNVIRKKPQATPTTELMYRAEVSEGTTWRAARRDQSSGWIICSIASMPVILTPTLARRGVQPAQRESRPAVADQQPDANCFQ